MQLRAAQCTSSCEISSGNCVGGSDGKLVRAGAADASAAAEQLSALDLGVKTFQSQQPLLSCFDLHGVAELISSGKAQKIVVMAGAGISVSAGIPDFRTPGTGLYSQLQRFNLPWPEAVFDIRYYRHDPRPFCMLAKELWPGYHKHAPTPTHHFLRLLHDKGLLLRVFSQNIDGLEQIAGVPTDKVVNAHGSFDGAHCIDCKQPCSIYAVQAAIYDDQLPACSSCGGLVKPDITFFGEALPARFHRRRLTDLANADLLIVMGTSLLVQPFASMIDQVPASTPRVLINLTRAGERHPQQQEKRQQQQPGGPSCRHLKRSCSSTSSCSSSGENCPPINSNDSDSESDEEDAGGLYSSEGASGASSPALTACNSTSDMASCCCSLDASAAVAEEDCEAAAETGAAAQAAQASTTAAGSGVGSDGSSSNNSSGGGFDFGSHIRDVLHLGDCDSAVRQLAALLGWQQELDDLVAAGDAVFKEAQSCWDD